VPVCHNTGAWGRWSEAYQDRGLVFCQADGKPLHAHNIVQRDFRPLVARAKLPRIRFHDLRHLHASYLFKAGVHPKVAQERLGHHSPAYTMKVYGHLLPGMQEEATHRIERLLRDPGDSRG
jgi:integrase